jgi:puromycin-sensitive aminopeptidase
MEMKATDAMRPDWKRWVSFGAAERPWAFSVDALASTRPVEFEVTSPDEANEMFDALTYGKGSSVLRMIEQYLGELTFQAGVGDYLRKHSYANTVTADLWEGLNRASSTDVGAVMDTWILQGGFPQVEVAATSQGIRLTQRRFLAMPDETDQTTWKIPVQVRGSAGGIPIETKVLLADTEQVVPIEGEIDWIVANGGGHGFYRVSYQPALATRMVDALPHLDDLERFVLIDDAWAFVESGQTGVGPYLDLAKAYRDETEHAVWTALVGGLSAVRHHITKDEDLARFGRLVADLVAPGFARLGWEPGTDDPDLTRRLRGLLLGALGRVADDPEVVERSGDIAARWLESPAGLDPDVAQAALFTWATHGGLDEQQRLLDAYRGAATPQAEMKLLQALAMVDGSDAVDATLAAILDGTVRSQDGAWVVARMLGGRSSGAHTWQRLRSDWSGLTAKMPPMTMRRLVEGLPALSQPAVSAEVHAFFAETDLPAIAKTVAQNLEKLRTNTNLRTAQADLLSEYLEG